MAFELIKCEQEKDNSEALYRLINVEEGIDVYFTYSNFHEVLDSIGFSSKRIGYIVRLLNRLYPLEMKKYRVPFEDSFTNDQLIEYLNFNGFMVKKVDDRLDVMTAIKILESRGYEVKGFLKSFLYKSPISEYNPN